MKEYYIYDSELREIKRVGAIATILFAIGSAAFGFAVNTHLGMVFADHLSDQTKGEWTIYRNVGIAAGIGCYFFAVLQSLVGYNQIEQIKSATLHGAEKYNPKSRYKVAVWALVFAACFAGGLILRPLIW